MDAWIPYLSVFSGLLMSVVGYLFGLIKNRSKSDKALRKGIQACLRYSMLMMYQNAGDNVTIEDKNTFEFMYQQYHVLGANGVMDRIYNEYMNKEIR